MKILDNLVIALGGIASNKLRSALTVLGVMIGVGAVILLVGVGTASSQAVQKSIDALGTNTLTVLNTGRFGGGVSSTGTQTKVASLTIADVHTLEDKSVAPDVSSVSPVISSSVTATYQGATYTTTVTGSTPSYLTAEDDTIAAGSQITSAEVTSHARVVDIGSEVASNLFPTGVDPIGKTIQLGSSSFQVIGVLTTKGSSGSTSTADAIAIAPYTAVQDELTGYAASFTSLVVQGTSSTTLGLAQTEVQSVLAAANDTTVAALPFNVVNQATLLTTASSTSSTFTNLLAAVAGISLLVGGIGVMNIMLVSVTERTREIGIRKAIGAPKSAILTQFLVEAVLVSLIGGLTGVIAAVAGSHLRIDGQYPVIQASTIVLAFGVAVAVGVFFGFYPANRAASLRPIDALRYE
ncbi:MAG: hypothetical protein JWO62_3362 [Acidimicrobiaceae bacterium]|jgi:putative ABC transport system permease protein|nr:hypothetical protein [Acidimicrobiaceae bacterium]